MSTTCSHCGVAVVPGYVRCPKCHVALPARAGRSSGLGGTTLPERGGFPLAAVLGGAIAAVAVVALVITMRGSTSPRTPTVAPTVAATTPTAISTTPPTAEASGLEPTTATTTSAQGVDPTAAIAAFDRSLDRQRLWSTTERVGTRLDLRGTQCANAAMGPAIAEAAPSLKAGGITKIRCLAQAGTVVMEQDL